MSYIPQYILTFLKERRTEIAETYALISSLMHSNSWAPHNENGAEAKRFKNLAEQVISMGLTVLTGPEFVQLEKSD